MATLYVFIGGNLSEERIHQTGAYPLCPSDISPHCGESPRTPFPKTFNRIFPPDRALHARYPNDKAKANPWHYKRNPIEDFVTEL